MFGKSPKVLRAVLGDVIEVAENELSTMARLVLQRAFEHWRELDEHLRWCDRQVGQHVRSKAVARPEQSHPDQLNNPTTVGAASMLLAGLVCLFAVSVRPPKSLLRR